MAVTAAKTGYATAMQLSNGASPAAYSTIAELLKVSGFGIERTVIEATNLLSPQEFKEFVFGMKTTKEFSLEVNYLPTSSTQTGLITNMLANSDISDRAWRLLLPDFGAVTKTATVITTTWTSTAHGYLTGQSIKLTTTGTIPTGFTVNRVYWLRRIDANSFSLHPTPEDAFAGTGAISASNAGTGTHTANGTSFFIFTGECKGFTCDPSPDEKLTGQIQFVDTSAATAPA